MSWLMLFFRTWGLPGDLRKFHPSYFRKAKAQWTTGSGRARDVPPSAGVERAVIRSELPFLEGQMVGARTETSVFVGAELGRGRTCAGRKQFKTQPSGPD